MKWDDPKIKKRNEIEKIENFQIWVIFSKI